MPLLVSMARYLTAVYILHRKFLTHSLISCSYTCLLNLHCTSLPTLSQYSCLDDQLALNNHHSLTHSLMFPATLTQPQDKRRLQLKADSGVLLSSPKQGLRGQYFQLKTRNSYSKCIKVPVSPRHQKTEDEMIVVHAHPMKPSEMMDLMLRKQNQAKAKLERQMTEDLLKKQVSIKEMGLVDENSMGANNKKKLKPINTKSKRKKQTSTDLPSSPIDKNRYRNTRNISPLKKETGLQNLTYIEARYKYKQQYPSEHPPALHMKKHKYSSKS